MNSSVLLLLLCCAGNSLAVKCWVSSATNDTETGQYFNMENPGVSYERECSAAAKNCLGIAYQVKMGWMYTQGCTSESLMSLTETKKGRGGHWKIVCDTDYCNGSQMFVPSFFVLLAVGLVKNYF